jgi:hypothetical protein
MARMKTGRLTTKTTPPDKYIVTSKRETVQPKQLTSKEAKYNADVEAGEKYKSDLATYNKNTEMYGKIQTTGSRSYGNFSNKGAVDLSPEGLNKYNSSQGDSLKAIRIQRPKDESESEYFKRISKQGGYVGHVDYEKPVAPKKVTPPNERDMPMGRMPLNKITGIKSRGKSIIKAKEKPEPALFDNPNKAVVGKNKSTHDSSGISRKTKNAKESFKEGIDVRDKVSTRNKLGYKREERLFKAKASTGAAGTDFTNLDSKDIKYARKNYLKKDLSAARTDTSLKPEERAKKIAAAKMEIKQSRGAQTYSRKMEKGKISHFNDENYKGNIIKDYKSSQDNINNKNTIDAKLKAIGEKAKSKPGSFGSMPTS